MKISCSNCNYWERECHETYGKIDEKQARKNALSCIQYWPKKKGKENE